MVQVTVAKKPTDSPFTLLVVKILLVLLIFLLLPQMVESRRRHTKKKAFKEYRLIRHACHGVCRSRDFPEESGNCVAACLSPACFQQVYGTSPLEDGEIDWTRAREFDHCSRLEITRAQRRQRALAIAAFRQSS